MLLGAYCIYGSMQRYDTNPAKSSNFHGMWTQKRIPSSWKITPLKHLRCAPLCWVDFCFTFSRPGCIPVNLFSTVFNFQGEATSYDTFCPIKVKIMFSNQHCLNWHAHVAKQFISSKNAHWLEIARKLIFQMGQNAKCSVKCKFYIVLIIKNLFQLRFFA